MEQQLCNNTFRPRQKVIIKDKKEQAALKTAIILTFSYALVEAIAGWYCGSLALMSDAGHMITDVAALLLAWLAGIFMQKPASKKHSYGFLRLEVVTALVNSVLMIVVIVGIIYEAIDRILHHNAEVQGGMVFIVALIGLVVNFVVIYILHHGEEHTNLNTRAALVHVIGDLLGSVAAILAGIIIYFTGWMIVDPLLSMVICVIVIRSVYELLKESFLVLMEGVPKNVDLHEVKKFIINMPKISGISDLHIWNLSSGYILLTAHIKIDYQDISDWGYLLEQLQHGLVEKFGIEHITIQPEFNQRII